MTLISVCAAADPPPQVLPTITGISVPTPKKIGHLNDPLDVTFDKLDVTKDLTKFALYLNGYAMAVEAPKLSGPNRLRFLLTRDEKTRDAWTKILGGPSGSTIDVEVAVRYDNNLLPVAPKVKMTIPFQVFVPWVAVFWAIVLLLMIGGFCIAAIRTNIIRDTVPPEPPEGKKRPYSLARTQMAWWFLIIIGSFIFIFAITQDWKTINEEALILMGIGTGAALGATIIEVTKQNNAESLVADQASKAAEVTKLNADLARLQAATPPDPVAIETAKAELAQKQAELAKINIDLAKATAARSSPVSKNFFDDLLTDANGANVHRFQMVGWTVVLGVIYLYGVWKLLALPDFPGTLNALLGISAGTYLGFKIPEKQA
ncbi:MAG TPA: hypothetical protein VJZ76_10210 [Thermoanaerobaculia bacterium]|nr:hypothetical protein [Thermoanaerobaculia bacterium]